MSKYEFDVAFSFAGDPDKSLAERLAAALRRATEKGPGLNVYIYTNGEQQEREGGKNLLDVLRDVYQVRSRHCDLPPEN
jgi:hypothetical protein